MIQIMEKTLALTRETEIKEKVLQIKTDKKLRKVIPMVTSG